MCPLIKLKCRHCGNALAGENNSRIFFCRVCDRGWDVDEEEMREYPLVYVRPEKESRRPATYFPFWRIESDYSVSDPQTFRHEIGNRIFFIPAFFIKNINYFGDIGYFYTQKRIAPAEGPKRTIPIFPADRGLKHVLAYPSIYLFKEISQTEDVERIEIRMEPKRYAILLIPFHKIDSEYVDSLISWRYPSGALI